MSSFKVDIPIQRFIDMNMSLGRDKDSMNPKDPTRTKIAHNEDIH